MLFWFINISTFLIVILQIINQWNVSKGNLKLVYPAIIAVAIMNIIVDTVVSIYDSRLAGLMLFYISNTWAVVMAAKGIARLKKEEKNG